MATAMVDISSFITLTPGLAAGEPHVVGAGIKVSRIALLAEEGRSPEEIAHSLFDTVTVAQVHAALAYYLANPEFFAELERQVTADYEAAEAELGHRWLAIGELWNSRDRVSWRRALGRYWLLVEPRNLELEQDLEQLSLERVKGMEAEAWYRFLHDEYFRWKYTARNRYATTTRALSRYVTDDALDELLSIKQRLLSLDPSNVRAFLSVAREIHGLGTAGASGLLALMYPQYFGTVDQFAVKALREVPGLAEAQQLARMNPEGLSVADGEVLILIMRRKAAELDEFDRDSGHHAR